MLALLDPTSLVSSSGYAAIFVLCVLQSCCVPTSSELTLGFAGVLAAEGKLSLPEVIAVGVAGEVIGAYVAWVIGRSAGRVVVDRWGKYILLSHRDLDRAEAWYDRHPRWGVLGSRLLPVIRNFVALPAGMAEVPPVRFGVLTFFGSLIWDSAMALIGYAVGSRWQSIMKGFNDAGYVLAGVVVLAVAVFMWHRYRSYKAATGGGRTAGPRGRHVAGRHARTTWAPSQGALSPQRAGAAPAHGTPLPPPPDEARAPSSTGISPRAATTPPTGTRAVRVSSSVRILDPTASRPPAGADLQSAKAAPDDPPGSRL